MQVLSVEHDVASRAIANVVVLKDIASNNFDTTFGGPGERVEYLYISCPSCYKTQPNAKKLSINKILLEYIRVKICTMSTISTIIVFSTQKITEMIRVW